MVRPYDATRDADALWDLKRGFELGLGAETGSDAKAAAYADKLDADYRDRWLDWVARCTDDDPRAVQVAPADEREESGGTVDGALAGYVFVLPESHCFIWDAAVLNELFVAPAARGTGVADALMDAALDYARDQALPLDRLVLDVDRENDRARAFYDRRGFEHWGEMLARDL